MSVTEYIRETRGELKHVNWLTRSQTIVYTVLVIGISLAVSLFLALCDYLFTYILEHFILK